MNSDKWSKIVQLHRATKELTLLAEEHELEWRKFIQPAMEEGHALEHIIRSKAAELGSLADLEPDNKLGYIDKNLDKAIGHLYRAFFDTADWLSVILRQKIINALKMYDNRCITAVMPEYYQKIRPNLEQINSEIAQIRKGKDIGKDISADKALIDQVEFYKEKLEKLLTYHKTIITKVPALEQYKNKEAKKDFRQKVIGFVIGVVVTVIGVIIAYLLNRHSSP